MAAKWFRDGFERLKERMAERRDISAAHGRLDNVDRKLKDLRDDVARIIALQERKELTRHGNPD